MNGSRAQREESPLSNRQNETDSKLYGSDYQTQVADFGSAKGSTFPFKLNRKGFGGAATIEQAARLNREIKQVKRQEREQAMDDESNYSSSD